MNIKLETIRAELELDAVKNRIVRLNDIIWDYIEYSDMDYQYFMILRKQLDLLDEYANVLIKRLDILKDYDV